MTSLIDHLRQWQGEDAGDHSTPEQAASDMASAMLSDLRDTNTKLRRELDEARREIARLKASSI